jgi:hypothetical protein
MLEIGHFDTALDQHLLKQVQAESKSCLIVSNKEGTSLSEVA